MKLLRYLLPATALAVMAGCDSILDTEPGDRIPIENAITDARTARAALLGAYDALQALSYYGRNFLVVGDLAGDNAVHTGTLTTLPDIEDNQITSDNGTLEGIWGAIYEAIARTNLIITRVPEISGLGDEERNQIMAEAYRCRSSRSPIRLWRGPSSARRFPGSMHRSSRTWRTPRTSWSRKTRPAASR
jgi:hypothetical protein